MCLTPLEACKYIIRKRQGQCHYAWSSAADVLACDGVSCRESARVLGLPAASTFVFANGIVWVQYVLVAWSVYPFVFYGLLLEK